MSYDSLNQYSQVIGKEPVSNWFPPIMVYLWKALYWLRPSPGTLLAFHQMLYWSAIAILSWALSSKKIIQLSIFVVVGFWPPLIIHSVHLWKDVGMFAAILLAIAALLADWKRPSWLWLLLSAVGIFYAFAVRYNAVVGVPFIAMIWAWRVVYRAHIKRYIAVSICIVAFVFTIATLSITKWVDGPTGDSGLKSIIVFDLAAISVLENKNLFPSYVIKNPNEKFLDELKSVFQPEVNYPINGLLMGVPESKNDAIKKYWLHTIYDYFPSYIKHRYYVFSRMLWISGPDPYYPYHPGIDENDMGIKFKFLDGPINFDWRAAFDYLSHLYIYKPIIYLVLSFFIFFYSSYKWIRKTESFKWFAIVMISGSGLSMTLSLFVFSPAADYRYSIWMIVTTIASVLGAVLLPDRQSSITNEV